MALSDLRMSVLPGDAVSLAEEYPKEQARLRELIEAYRAIGWQGAFGCAEIERVLRDADLAMASGDVVQMVKSYQAMQGCK